MEMSLSPRVLLSLVALMSVTRCGAQAPPSCTHKPLQECHARGTAVYEVAFHGDWITPLPPMGASFSPLVGMSHSACASLWSPYEYSTLGVQAVAENGTTATVRNEIMSFGRNTFSVFESALLDQIEIGTVVTNVTVDAFRPLVSAVSKVTPSPDWFTGVYDILLCDDDEWPAIISVNMLLWDAGSDSGVNYTSVNNASDPRQFIEQLTPQSNRSVVFSPNSVNAATPVPVGRLSFRRVAVYEDQIAENPNCHTCGRVGDRPGVHNCSCETPCFATGTAVYFVKLTTNWVDPEPPSMALFSPVTVASHSTCSVLWRNLVYATQGIQTVSETGNRSFLLEEIMQLGGHVGNVLEGPHVDPTGVVSGLVEVDQYHPVISMISMMAPSPDWFIGVDSVPMCSPEGWVQSATYRLFPWDSGTDSGLSFTSADDPTLPHERVTRIRSSTEPVGSIFRGREDIPFATVSFQRVDLRSGNLPSSASSPMCSSCNDTVSCVRSYDVITNNTLVAAILNVECQSLDGFVSESNVIAYCFIAAFCGMALGCLLVFLLAWRRAAVKNKKNKYAAARGNSVTSQEQSADHGVNQYKQIVF